MFNFYKIGRVMLSAVVAVTFSTSVATAAPGNTDTDNASATARVVKPLSMLTVGDTISFGKFIAPGAGDGNGTVTIQPGFTGARSASPNIALLPDVPSRAAAFLVNGEPNEGYEAIFPPLVTITGGGSDMTVTLFTTHPEGSSLALDNDGSDIITVGATLQVDENQAGGEYSGDFDVTVTYQ